MRCLALHRKGAIFILLCICQLPQVTVADAEEAPPSIASSQTAPLPTLEQVETEIVAFSLRGKRARERFELPDLAIIARPDGQRLLPLLQLLGALGVDFSNADGKVSFQPEGSPPLVLDKGKKELRKNESVEAVGLVEAVSDVSMKAEIFLAPETIATIFNFELSWDDEIYGFVARTDRSLSIWQRPEGVSLLAVETTAMSEQLPEAHPAAQPSRRLLSLDFIELQARTKFLAKDPNVSQQFNIDSLEQTFWGSMAYGKYKVRVSEPTMTWNSSATEWSEDPAVMVDWGEWRYRDRSTEVVAGDSVFGLNGLIFPSVRMTGVRYNGVFDATTAAGENERAGMGSRNVIAQPQTFEGLAQVGSRVELLLNDRVVDTKDVRTSLPSMPGTGAYRFEGITLGPGSLNNIRIVITDPDGVVTVIEKTILGSSALLSKGSVAFLSGLGTNRDTDEWGARGFYSGGKVYLGVHNRLTVGATLAHQQNFFEAAFVDLYDPEDRQYPASSQHAGTHIIWQPFDHTILAGDLSWMRGDDENGKEVFRDPAYTLDWQFSPWEAFGLHVLGFSYGTDFFNGSNLDLRDRRGYVCNPHWQPSAKWKIGAAAGQVWDNIAGERDETRSVNFQNGNVSTILRPGTAVSFALDRLEPNWGEDAKTLFSSQLRSQLFAGINFSGSYATGDDLSLSDNADFLQGLRFPGMSLFATRSTSVLLEKGVGQGDSLALSYWETGRRERGSIIYKARFARRKIPIEMRTEIGFDVDKHAPFFENRTEIPLGIAGSSRLGLRARSEDDEWKVEIFLNINELFSCLGGRPVHVANRRKVNPESGMVTGRVFLDRNANALLDPGERGIEGVEVILDKRRPVVTDKNGQFLHSIPGVAKDMYLNLNPDTVPANYGITHGQQQALCKEGELTEVNFGLTPLNAALGYVMAEDQHGVRQPIAGIRVFVTAPDSEALIAESITAADGSYYLQDIRPGSYRIQLDPGTIPAEFTFQETTRQCEMQSSDDQQEIEIADFNGLAVVNPAP